jgi:hypothetical protein
MNSEVRGTPQNIVVRGGSSQSALSDGRLGTGFTFHEFRNVLIALGNAPQSSAIPGVVLLLDSCASFFRAAAPMGRIIDQLRHDEPEETGYAAQS